MKLEVSHTNRHADILDRCRKGEQKAYREVYQLYSKAMFNICFRIVGNRELAEDALQEAFVSAFQNLQSFEGRSSFGAWLKRIFVNKSISFVKKYQPELVQGEAAMEAIDEVGEDEEDVKLQVEKVRAAIQQLPAGFRVVFSLYLLEGYDHKEIAEILQVSVSTSKSQYNRAKKKLKEILKEEVYDG
jgi:RNA polymerase sigma factor (sigma-70 family)